MTNDEWELRRRMRAKKKERVRRIRRRRAAIALLIVLCLAVMGGVLLLFKNGGRDRIDLTGLETPSWIRQQFFDKNPYSRPGEPLNAVDGIVVHYVANPGTTAQNNWNYFNGLANQNGSTKTSASSHFIIGLDGEIIQGIPLDEIAYATSKERNLDTISIECCHPDATGEFTEKTYESLVKLTGWLCETLNLNEKDVIRHYDATKKACPKYYVDHEDLWKKFRKDVKNQLKSQATSTLQWSAYHDTITPYIAILGG